MGYGLSVRGARIVFIFACVGLLASVAAAQDAGPPLPPSLEAPEEPLPLGDEDSTGEYEEAEEEEGQAPEPPSADAGPTADARPAEAPVVRAPLPALVQIPKDVPPLTGSAQLTPSADEIKKRLETRARLLRAGDRAGATTELAQLLELREVMGVINMPLASAALLHSARTALEAGDARAAVADAEAAAALSPELVAAHWMRFHAHLAADGGGVGAAIGAAIDGVATRFRGFRNQVALLTDLLGVWFLTLVAVALILALLALARYGGCAAFDVASKLPGWAGRGVGWALILLVLLLPLALGLGVAPTLAGWLILASLYQPGKERVVSLLVVGLLSVSPLVLRAASPLILFHGSEVDALATAASEAFAPQAEAKLAAHATGTRDFDAAFVLAGRARTRGELGSAQRWLEEAVRIQPSSTAAQNNLGVVLYLQRRSGEALNALTTATRRRDRAEPFLNLASLQLDQSNFDEARRSIDAARELDPQLAARYNDLDAGVTTAAKLLTIPFDQGVLWDRLFALDGEESDAVVAQLWRIAGGRTPPHAMPIAGAALIVLVLLAGARQLRFSRPCPKCGMPASPRAVESYCDQCHSIFLKAVAVEPSMRLEKEHAIRRHQRRRRWAERVLAVFAGAGHVFGGRAIEGTLLLAAFTAVFAHLWWMERLSVHAWATGLGFGAPQLAASAVLALVLVLISVGRSLNR